MWTLPHPVYPCPFCGSTALRALSVGGGGLILCTSCQAQGPVGATQALAEQYWVVRGQALPKTCLWCQTLYTPALATQQYCTPACGEAAVAQAERADARLTERWARVRARQAERERLQRQRKAAEELARARLAERELFQMQRKGAQELARARQRLARAEYQWELVRKEGEGYATPQGSEGEFKEDA